MNFECTILGKPVRRPTPESDSMLGASSMRGSTRLQSSQQCERKWQLSQVERLYVKFEREDTLCGKLIHALAAYDSAAQLDAPPMWYFEKTATEYVNELGAQEPAEVLKAVTANAAYRWAKERERIKFDPVYVEAEIGVTVNELLGYDCGYAGNELVTARFDRIERATSGPKAGQLFLIDLKTKASTRGDRLPVWQPDRDYFMAWQQLFYMAVAKAWFEPRGEQIAGFVIERIKQQEPHNYDRNPVQISDLALSEVPGLVLTAVLKELELVSHTSPAPLTGMLSGNCSWGSFPCDFQKLCGAPSLLVRESARKAWFTGGEKL